MRKTEAVIFDWAGTTVDYGCFAPVQAFMQVFTECGIIPTMEEVRMPMGMLKWDHIKAMLQMPRIKQLFEEQYKKVPEDSDVDRLYEKFEPALFSLLERFAEPNPYVVETVEKLRDRWIKVGSTTGYTDSMMAVVAPKAKEAGYEPDCLYSPDAVEHMGRPYPYMIYKNMQHLHVPSVSNVIKVGDTISDIWEGRNAGVLTIGVLEGSSLVGLTKAEYETLSEQEREKVLLKAEQEYKNAGADAVIRDIRGILDYV